LARIEQRSQTNIHAFPRTVGYKNILRAGDPRSDGLPANGLKRFRDSLRGRVAILVIAHRAIRSFDYVRRRGEIKDVGIANVEIQNFVPLPLDLIGKADQVTDGIA